MLAQPANPQPTKDVHPPHKCQVPLNANGEPVAIGPAPKRKKLALEQAGKKNPMPAKLKKITSVLAPAKQKPSIEIEEVSDDNDQTQSELDDADAAQCLEAMDVNGDSDAEEVEPPEKPEEDEEEELGQYPISTSNDYFLSTFICQLACQRNGPHQFMYSLRPLLKLHTRMAIVLMSLNVGPAGAKGITARFFCKFISILQSCCR